MKSKNMFSKLVLLPLVFAAGQFAAANANMAQFTSDRDGFHFNDGGRWRQAQVCFYQDSNFNGRSFCMQAGDRPQYNLDNFYENGFKWNDQISSIRFFGDVNVRVYSDSDFRGSVMTVSRDLYNLADYRGWNDVISSIEIEEAYQPPVEARVCFFENIGRRGNSFCVSPGDTEINLDTSRFNSRGFNWNDQISSVLVEGDATVMVFQGANFLGQSAMISDSSKSLDRLGRNWNDSISSFRVMRRGRR